MATAALYHCAVNRSNSFCCSLTHRLVSQWLTEVIVDGSNGFYRWSFYLVLNRYLFSHSVWFSFAANSFRSQTTLHTHTHTHPFAWDAIVVVHAECIWKCKWERVNKKCFVWFVGCPNVMVGRRICIPSYLSQIWKVVCFLLLLLPSHPCIHMWCSTYGQKEVCKWNSGNVLSQQEDKPNINDGYPTMEIYNL